MTAHKDPALALRRLMFQFAAMCLSVAFGLFIGEEIFRLILACVTPAGTRSADYIAQSLVSTRTADIVWSVTSIWLSTVWTGFATAFIAAMLIRLKPAPRTLLAVCTSLSMVILYSPLATVFSPMNVVTGSAVAAAASLSYTLWLPRWAEKANLAFLAFGGLTAG